jgi:hypothetical protein
MKKKEEKKVLDVRNFDWLEPPSREYYLVRSSKHNLASLYEKKGN